VREESAQRALSAKIRRAEIRNQYTLDED